MPGSEVDFRRRSPGTPMPQGPMKKTSGYCPLFLSLEARRCVVIGGGRVAERKIRRLQAYGAAVSVVARELTDWLTLEVKQGRIRWLGTSYHPSCLEKADLVFVASGDRELNRRAAEDAMRRGLWCNMASDPELGTFIVPASFRRGPLTIAVGTDGLSPAVARMIRQRLEKEFGPEWEEMLRFLGILRNQVQERSDDTRRNQEMFRSMVSLPLVEWFREHKRAEIVRAVGSICKGIVTEAEVSEALETAWKTCS